MVYVYELPKRMRNAAIREANTQIEDAHAFGIFDDGDPNNPKYNNGINYRTGMPVHIFGYAVDMFMDKQ